MNSDGWGEMGEKELVLEKMKMYVTEKTNKPRTQYLNLKHNVHVSQRE